MRRLATLPILAPQLNGRAVVETAGGPDRYITVKVEVELSPVVSTAELLELARLVDDAGADRLGISDVALMRDSLLMQGLCAQVTRRVHIGSLVSNPYVRHPAVVAAALGTLSEVSQGRAFLGIGVGAGLSGLGIDQSHPVRRLEEFLLVTKALLSGETVDWESPNYRIKGARLSGGIAAPVPVVIGTRSRLVARLAGRMADAVVVGAREMTPNAPATIPRLGERGSAGGGPQSRRSGNSAPGNGMRVQRRYGGAAQRDPVHRALPVIGKF